MYCTKSLAFEIKSPFKDKHGHRQPILSVWHNDPSTDGTDDSCGWFIRLRHADKNVYEKIVKEFEAEWDSTYKSDNNGYIYNCGWFTPQGAYVLSVQAIVFNMYLYASKIVFNPYEKISPRRAWKKAWRFMDKHHSEIVYFAENNRDSMSDNIIRKFEIGCNEAYTSDKRMAMIKHCASIIYTDILRKERKWWQHPKFHIHHWSIQFNLLQGLKRRYWDKCSICGKRGFKGSAMSDGSGTKMWHQECDSSNSVPCKSNDYKELLEEATLWYSNLYQEQLNDIKELSKTNSSLDHDRLLIDLYMKHSRNIK